MHKCLYNIIATFLFLRDEVSVDAILHAEKIKRLPVDTSQYQRIVIRRRHLWEDALERFQLGINFHKYIHVTFIQDPAVDEGGPLREFLRLLMGRVATNNCLFCGGEDCRVPTPNMMELEKRTYQHVGEMIAVSLIHGGPAPSFFASSVVNYMVYGLKKVKASVDEVPYSDIVKKLKEVSLETVWYHYILENV